MTLSFKLDSKGKEYYDLIALEGLPPSYNEIIDKNSHLLRYLNELKNMGYGIPSYVVQLSRNMRYERNINIIYPIGDPLFVHIHSQDMGGRAKYNVIEPMIPLKNRELIRVVEEALAYRIKEDFEFKSKEEYETKLKKLLRRCVRINNNLKELGKYVYNPKKRIVYTNYETFSVLEYTFVKEKVGLGIIEPLMRDVYLEDISCVGVGPMFIVHKVFGSCETNVGFNTHAELDDYIQRLSERIGRPVSYRRPIVDAVLPDGSRINMVYGGDVSMKGSNFTIRKFSPIPISITELCAWNTLSFQEAAYLWLLLEEGLNVWVSGETASGKTTTMNAMTAFIRPDAKIVSIEDTPEVMVPQENWIREVTRISDDERSSIELYDLLKSALRQRPTFIIVGEIRGKEGNVAFQAMQTGHGVLSTFHAHSVEKLIQRLTGSPIEIPKTYIDILNAIVVQSIVRNPKTGKIERRVLNINEIVGYEPVEQSFNYIEIFRWDPITDKHVFRGIGTSYLLEEKIATMRGIPRKRIKMIYEELDKRAEILKLLADKKVFDYYEVWSYMKKIYGLGIDEALTKLRRGEIF
jgi:flagellar protein FlaI